MRALVYDVLRRADDASGRCRLRPCRRGGRRRPGRGHRPVPQRLARLAGPRPGHRAAARARPRAGRDGRGRRAGRARLAGRRPGHRAVRLRAAAGAPRARPATSRCASTRRSPASPTGARSPSWSRSRPPTSTSSRCRTSCPSRPPPAWAAASRTAYRAVVHQGRVRPGEWVAVHGCGGVGLSAIQIAVAAGARVVAVDVAPGALELARELGAQEAVDSRGLDSAAVARAVRTRHRRGSAPVAGRPRQPRHLHRLGVLPAGARPPRAGRPAAAGAGAPGGADGPGRRPRARAARQPRHAGTRLSRDARPDRLRPAAARAADHAASSPWTRPPRRSPGSGRSRASRWSPASEPPGPRPRQWSASRPLTRPTARVLTAPTTPRRRPTVGPGPPR